MRSVRVVVVAPVPKFQAPAVRTGLTIVSTIVFAVGLNVSVRRVGAWLPSPRSV